MAQVLGVSQLAKEEQINVSCMTRRRDRKSAGEEKLIDKELLYQKARLGFLPTISVATQQEHNFYMQFLEIFVNMRTSQLLLLPRAVAHSNRRALLSLPRRSFTSSYNRQVADDNKSSPFGSGPAPPRLPKEEQEIFERLQKESTGAFSTPRTPPKVNQSPDSLASTSTNNTQQNNSNGQGEELFPHMRETVKPEFEGDTNPKTGEVGGPKNEPLRWGHEGDWSYNGRVTDF